MRPKDRFSNNELMEPNFDFAQEQVLARLLESRILFLSGDLDENKSKDVVSKLITLDYQSPTKDILFYIDSYGGDIHCLLAIHDAMRTLCRCDIATICVGKAMSAAAILLLAGTDGKRFITPNSRVMLHELSTGDEGKLTYMKGAIVEAEKLQALLEGFVKDYTKLSDKQVKTIFGKDSYMDAKLAKKFGVVDHIIDHPNVLHQKINM
jgi:ATP-dependent Clp protease protease subunit